MDVHAAAHGLLYTRKGVQWHRRYVILRGSSLELFNLDYVEKEVRNSKDEGVNVRDLSVCLECLDHQLPSPKSDVIFNFLMPLPRTRAQ